MTFPTGNQWGGNQKWHQFWCHSRNPAPESGINFDATGENLRQFGASFFQQLIRYANFEPKTNYFREKRIKTDFSCSTPWGTKKYHSTRNFWRFSMATLWGRKNFYQSGLFLALLDAYQMGEKFSKSFIKIEFSCSIPWKEKIIRKNFIFFALPCSTPWGDLSEISEAIHKIRVFVLYHLREKNIYGKGAVFDHPRCLPIEGRKIYFFKRLNF